jgi:hypothetical protein
MLLCECQIVVGDLLAGLIALGLVLEIINNLLPAETSQPVGKEQYEKCHNNYHRYGKKR